MEKIKITDNNVRIYEKFYNLKKGNPVNTKIIRFRFLFLVLVCVLIIPMVNHLLFFLLNFPKTLPYLSIFSCITGLEGMLSFIGADRMIFRKELDKFHQKYPTFNMNINVKELEKALIKYEELSEVEKNFEEKKEEYLENYQESFRSMTPSEKIASLEKEKEFWEQEKILEKNETPELDIHKELGQKKI